MKKITLILFSIIASVTSFAQDTCAEALPITGAGTFVVDVINGTQLPPITCVLSNTGATAAEWYAYTPSQNYNVTVTSDLQANICGDTRVRVYRGNCASLTCVTGDDDAGIIQCNSGNTNSLLSVVNFTAFVGNTYYIVWDNRWRSNGFTFQVIENPYVAPPPPPITYNSQTVSTINNTYNICVVDMNGDYLDDIVGVSANELKVHYQQSNGTFNIVTYPITGTSKMPTWSLAAGDFNKDGFNDLMFGNGSGATFWNSNSTGTAYSIFNPSQYIFSQRTNYIDLNNDGHLDAFFCHDVAPNVYYLNDGNNNYTHYQCGVTPGAYNLGTLSSGGNYASLWTDFDNDGDMDLFISKCSGPACELFRNDGNGVYTDISASAQVNFLPVHSWSSAIADFDNDGDMDILVGSNGSSRSRLLRNDLNTTTTPPSVVFTNINTGSGFDTDTSINRDYIAFDFDNDGRVDVMGGGNKIMFNQGNNVFSAVSYSGISVGAVGDLNNDGFLDIQLGNIIRYGIPNGNNWLKVTLRGVQSNRNGIGARVEITGPFGKKIRDIRSGEGFKYMNTLNAHFGLGTFTTIDQLVIKWPSGVTDILYNVPVNGTTHVVEGSSLNVNDVSNNAFAIFPNPAKTSFTIQNITSNNQISTVEIYDLTGKLISQTNYNNNEVNVSKLSKGIYLVLLIDNQNNRYTHKLIKE